MAAKARLHEQVPSEYNWRRAGGLHLEAAESIVEQLSDEIGKLHCLIGILDGDINILEREMRSAGINPDVHTLRQVATEYRRGL